MRKTLNLALSYPKLVIFIFLLFALLSIIFAKKSLEIDTSTESLINQKLDFKINQKKMKDEFKVLSNNILISIKGKDKKEIDIYTQKLLKIFKTRDDLNFFYSPSIDEIFKNNFFNFLNVKEKKRLVEKLYDYQPFLSEMNNNPRLEGFNNLLELAIKENNLEFLEQFTPILSNFNESLEKNIKVDWSKVLDPGAKQNFIILGFKNNKKIENFFYFLKNQKAENPNFIIEYTGGLIIDYEEVKTVSNSNLSAGFLSIIIVSVILLIAFRNVKLIFFLVLSILVGLSITIGIVTITIGKLNLISVAFAVLFIGLSVDYGIQILSRIFEKQNKMNRDALIFEVSNISKTLFLASIPSMIGFLSFIPTNYTGLSELGIISFIGLVVGLITNLIFLPTLFLFLIKKTNLKINNNSNRLYKNIINFLSKKKKYVFGTILIIFFFNLVYIDKLSFNYDAMSLKDQDLPSVKLAKEIIKKNPGSDYIISVIFSELNKDEIDRLQLLLKKKSVDSYFSYLNFDKKYVNDELDYLKFLLKSQKNNNFFSEFSEIKRFENNLLLLSLNKNSVISDIALDILKKVNIDKLNEEKKKELEQNLFVGFDLLINQIQGFGVIEKNFFDKLPLFYKQKYLSEKGNYRVEIFPSKNVTEKKNLDDFILDVESIFSNATGMPIVQQKAGKVVINSFIFAMSISITFLLLFVYFIFRDLYIVFLSTLSLFLGTMFSIFLMILFKINLNFANMIALPLLYSLGISFPIYFFRRFVEFNYNLKDVLDSNTPNAIFFSAATTMGSFSTLAISSHSGTSSMGILLFICLLMTVVSTILITPLFLDKTPIK